LQKRYSIVTDLNNLSSNIYSNDTRLFKLIKKAITSQKRLNKVIKLLDLNLKEKESYNDFNIINEILNMLKNSSIKKEIFFKEFYENEIKVEELESKYLNLYYYFFLFYREDILKGLKSGLRIKD